MDLVIKDELIKEVLSSKVTTSWVTSNFNLEDFREEKEERSYQGDFYLEGTFTEQQLLDHVSNCFSEYEGEVFLEVERFYEGVDFEFYSIISHPETDKEVVSKIQRLVNLRKKAIVRAEIEVATATSLQQEEKALLVRLKEKYPDN